MFGIRGKIALYDFKPPTALPPQAHRRRAVSIKRTLVANSQFNQNQVLKEQAAGNAFQAEVCLRKRYYTSYVNISYTLLTSVVPAALVLFLERKKDMNNKKISSPATGRLFLLDRVVYKTKISQTNEGVINYRVINNPVIMALKSWVMKSYQF